MAKQTHLITIDPQNDFCIKTGPGGEQGALVVDGADKDMSRLGAFLTKNRKRIDEIHCTLDSHQVIHIAHPIFWVDGKGKNPNPFTMISNSDVKNGVWRAYNPKWQGVAQNYTEQLEKNGRYVLVIWPPHCLIGSWGHSIVPCVANALYEWEKDTFNRTHFVAKGSNMFTEHYSALVAEVQDTKDPSTKLNTSFIESLQNADEIILSGEALSHCLANSVTDIAKEFGDDNVKKFILFTDCSSSVGGFEKLGENFISSMVKKGMKLCKSTDW